MKIKDIQNRQELVLITDSQEIKAVAEGIGKDLSCYGCLFVEIIGCEYGDIYACLNSIPYLDQELFKVNSYVQN
jgi:hypothetical protein